MAKGLPKSTFSKYHLSCFNQLLNQNTCSGTDTFDSKRNKDKTSQPVLQAATDGAQ